MWTSYTVDDCFICRLADSKQVWSNRFTAEIGAYGLLCETNNPSSSDFLHGVIFCTLRTSGLSNLSWVGFENYSEAWRHLTGFNIYFFSDQAQEISYRDMSVIDSEAFLWKYLATWLSCVYFHLISPQLEITSPNNPIFYPWMHNETFITFITFISRPTKLWLSRM